MKLTKEMEAAVLEVYHAYWYACFKGDKEYVLSTLDKDAHIMGNPFYATGDKRTAVESHHTIPGQSPGEQEFRNRKIDPLRIGDNVMVQELCDLYRFTDNTWNVNCYASLSTLFVQNKKEWKIIHQQCAFTPITAEQDSNAALVNGTDNTRQEEMNSLSDELALKTRELQIEAALEKVRSSVMTMGHSEELKVVARIITETMQALHIETGGGISLITFVPDSKDLLHWYVDPAPDKDAMTMLLPYFDDLVFNECNEAREKGLELFSRIYSKADKNRYFSCAFEHPEFRVAPAPFRQWILEQPYFGFSFAIQKNSGIFLNDFRGIAFSKEDENVLIRFSRVFEQAYIRFLDLQKAEALIRESLVEVALERVRARALSMQQPEELKEVAEVLRHEMGLLGVEELETCSIYIRSDSDDKAECWYAIKDVHEKGKKLVTDHFALNLEDTWVGRKMYKFYQSSDNKVSILMQGEHRREWIHYCEKFSILLRGFYGETIPDRTYQLYKFSHGAIGAATPGDISDESWNLLKRAAAVFSLAYSRFSDLTKARTDLQNLQEEKRKADVALKELQITQKQLIQSEKMASLGELTAGIAHEIQNPLNFVNNFSEVNNELIEELKEERKKNNNERDMELEDQILEDISKNLEKINHHGKRADAIVRGMLQHSRSGSSVKESTDLNALADEYLRLCYHGLRAKDKSFNSTIHTDFDPALGLINMVPQDIGRVILNLLTNAFYAVNEKKKKLGDGYEPVVSITSRLKVSPAGIKQAELLISDNAGGIPAAVLDKIFQPFFTTKPSGQGTGLGLSLAFESIQAHGGEISVKTKTDELGTGDSGTVFTILLPV